MAIGDPHAEGLLGPVYTIGHSNHPTEKFVGLLKGHGIEILADTRSHPYSKHVPHYNTRALRETLSAHGIGYLFLGGQLGGRPEGEEFYDTDGRVDYALLGASRPFLDSICMLENKLRTRRRIALLCSEEDPSACHRRLLIGYSLRERGVSVRHIRGDGSVQTEGEKEMQLALFHDAEVDVPRKSIRSVSRKRRRPGSSEL